MTEWIKCSERMPEEEGQYLVIVLSDRGERVPKKPRMKVARFHTCWGKHKRPHFFGNQTFKAKEITHWMPLPSLPKDES